MPDDYNYRVFGHYPSSCFVFKTTFQRLDSVSVFREKLTHLSPVDRASPYLWTCGLFETVELDPVF
jgi:hypothetical protein